MKLFWDTNMLIDLITARSPFGSDAQTLFELGKMQQVERHREQPTEAR